MDYLRGLFGSRPDDASKVWQEFVETGGKEEGRSLKIVKNADKDFKLEYITQRHFRRPSREALALSKEITNVVTHQQFDKLSVTALKAQIQAIDCFLRNHYVGGEESGQLIKTREMLIAKTEELESKEPPSPKPPPSTDGEGGISSDAEET